MATTPVFRVTTYQIPTGAYSGKSYSLHLRHELSTNYFCMVQWSLDDSGDISPADLGVQVIADPYGTGGLSLSGGNWIVLERQAATTNADIYVTVVECLRDEDGAGFRLLDVAVTALTAAGGAGVQSLTDTSTATFSPSRVALFGGFRGGGMSTTTTAAANLPTLSPRIYPSGTNTLNFVRNDVAGTQVQGASCTTYVVQWGWEWNVLRATVTGTAYGATLDNTSHYDTAALGGQVPRASAWLWSCGYTDKYGAGDSGLSQVATLGDGVTQNATETTVAVGCANGAVARSVEVYVFSHAKLTTDWVFKTAAAGSGSYSFTVGSSAGEETYSAVEVPLYVVSTQGRLPYLQASAPSGLSSELGQALLRARHTASTTVLSSTADQSPSLAWVGWLLSADFTGLVTEQDSLPTFRVTTYAISSGFTTTSYDLTLNNALSSNYFAMVVGSTTGGATPAPKDVYAWVSQDPFGTGDLGVSAGASTIRLARATATAAWTGTVTVVESLRGSQVDGFRLIDVRSVSLAAFASVGVQVVNGTANSAWTDLEQVVLFGGHRGGGITPAAGVGAADIQTMGVALIPTGNDGITVLRYTDDAATCKAATCWVYVVQWGSAWQVQPVLAQGVAGGSGVNVTGEYQSFYFDTPVDPAKTWVWAAFAAAGDTTDSCWLSPSLHLGDGVSQAAEENRVAVGLWASSAFLGSIYVMTHPDMAVDWAFQASTTSTSTGVTVDTTERSASFGSTGITTGQRGALAYTANSSSATPPVVVGAMVKARPQGYTNISLTRGRGDGPDWAGWIQSFDFGSIETRIGAVTVATADALKPTPQAYLILQDPHWDGSASITRITSEGGRMAGAVVPATDNMGSVVGFIEGTPEDDVELDFRLRGGAVGGSGGWVWRLSTESTSADWKAMNALTTFWRQNGITTSDRLTSQDVGYSTAYRQLLVAYVKSVTEIRIYKKDADDVLDSTSWTYSSIVTTDCVDPADPIGGVGICELPDGTMLLAYVQQDQTNGYYNVAAYNSVDGGSTWTRQITRLLTRTSLGVLAVCQGYMHLRASGDWVRMAVLKEESTGAGAASSYLQTLVSPDRGASWSYPGQLQCWSWKTLAGYPGSFPVAMEGIGDVSGTFILAYLPSTSSSTLAVAFAARDEAWERDTSLNFDCSSYATSAEIKSVCFVRDPERLWLFVWVEGSDASEIIARYCPLGSVTDSTAWITMGKITGFAGGLRYGPHCWRAVWAGHRLVLSGGLHDPDVAAGDDPVVVGHWMMQSGAHDPRPWDYSLLDISNNDYLISGYRLVSYQWIPAMGNPAGGGADSDSLTPWTRTIVGTGAAAWSKAAVTYAASANTDVAYHELNLGLPASISDRWGAASLPRGHAFHFRLQATAQRVAASSAEDMGVRIVALIDASNGYDVTLRVGTTQVVVYDNMAGSALETVTTTDLASECEVRIVLHDDEIYVHWRKVSEGAIAAWTDYGPFTMTSGAKAAQYVRIGVLAATGSGTSSILIWKDFAISYQTDAGQAHDIAKPTDMMGTRLNRAPILVENGLRVAWAGSGAMDTDTFSAPLDYSRGQQNLSLASPRFYWESKDLTEQELLFRASTASAYPRWQINAMLLIGTVDRTCTLQFSPVDSVAAWAAPAAEYELSADLYTDLTVMEVDGASLRIVDPNNEVLPTKGSLVGCYFRLTASGTATGKTYRIQTDIGDESAGGRWLGLAGDADLGAAGVAIGAKGCIFGDRMVFLSEDFNRYHYFRLVFPDLSSVGSSLGTSTGTHRLGALVPGFFHHLNVPMDWTHTDNEQPNTTEYRTKGGASFRYEEGPAQRIFRGVVVGDVEEQRISLRNLLKSFHGYASKPVGLVLDSTETSRDNVIYGFWSAGGQLDQAAYYQDADGRWRRAGDADVLITEEV